MSQPRVFACHRLLTPGRVLAPAVIRVEEGRVVSVDTADPPADAIDLGGTVAPGLIDLQCNGFGPHDVLTGTSGEIEAIAGELLACGVTAWLPTIVSSPEEARLRALDAVAAARPGAGARILGVHLEGPWISAERRGAHDPAMLRPPEQVELDRSLGRHPGLVKVVTLAPELPGGLEAVGQVVAAGAVASIGHTIADQATALRAVDAGARMVTHLFNGMDPFHHRGPGIVGTALTDERLVCGLIGDGVHVDPVGVALAFRAKGHRGVVLVSDAVAGAAAAGRPAAQTSDGTLAGARAGLDAGVRTAVGAGIGLPHALASATAVPAHLLHARVGRLEPLFPADFVVLDQRLRPVATYLAGERAWPT